MAKNRVHPDSTSKKKDSFFTRPQQKFKSYKADKFKAGKNNSQYSVGAPSFKPSVSGSDDFFVKTGDNIVTKKSQGQGKKIKQEKTSFGQRYPRHLPNQDAVKNSSAKQEKKPFDKKRYRLQKYSKKYKLEQWEQHRKKAILQGYYRNLKDDEPKLDVKTIYDQHKDEIEGESDNVDDKIDEENENNLNADINDPGGSKEEPVAPKSSKQKKNKAFKKAQLEFERIREDKQKKRDEVLRKKAEKEEALQAYKKKKSEKFKKLSRKTKRGQPIMKERMEMLLEKIQNSLNK